MKKLILFCSAVLALLIWGTIWAFYNLDGEQRDWQVMEYLQKISSKADEYQRQYGSFPKSLTDIKMNEQICFFKYCYKVKYQLAKDAQSFVLVSKLDPPHITYFYPGGKGADNIGYNCCWGIVDNKDYLKDEKHFPKQFDWPDF